jgi:hypothetical protein
MQILPRSALNTVLQPVYDQQTFGLHSPSLFGYESGGVPVERGSELPTFGSVAPVTDRWGNSLWQRRPSSSDGNGQSREPGLRPRGGSFSCGIWD